MMERLFKEDKILLAGANGMVGKAIFRALKKNGYGEIKNGGKIFTPLKNELNFLNYQELNNWFTIYKPDVVIIAAAKVGGIQANKNYPADFLLENLTIQNNLISIAWKKNVRRLLFLGSSCIYPKISAQPIEEEYLLNGALEKTNESYALAKIAGIKLCESLRNQYKFDAISCMPSNLYGPYDNYNYDNSHVLPALIRKFSEAKYENKKEVVCWGTGNPLREFLHVDDLADACLFLLKNWIPEDNFNKIESNLTPLNWINVGTGKEISIKDLAELIKDFIGYEGKISWDKSKPDGTLKKKLSVKKINSLGWSSKIKLKDGIKATIKCFYDEKIKGELRI